MKKLLFLIAFITLSISCFAQKAASFTVEVTTDSILMGNSFKVTFSVKNGQGVDFQLPEFADFHVVGGPNQSSSYSMVNGDVTQEMSYSFYLEPKEIGNYYIEPAGIEIDGEYYETQPMEVIVVPNPDGIKQQPERRGGETDFFRGFDFDFPTSPTPPEPPAKKKKKRKTYRL